MHLQDYIINGDVAISEMMKRLDANGHGILFVCEENNIIKGVITDGDVRRYLIRNGKLSDNISSVTNFFPLFFYQDEKVNAINFMKKNRITAVPMLKRNGEICRIYFDTGEVVKSTKELGVPVVIMAGGKGTRLYPYTQILPKPLIPIGDKTITEHIIDRFKSYGCSKVTMIVNYKKKFIETYFADQEGDESIEFVEEEEFYGTGGGLKLLGERNETFFMTNCDILVDVDLSDVLEKHKTEKNIITLVCADKHIEIPYGTVEIDESGAVQSLKEKPFFSCLTNTGFYVIEPDFLNVIPENEFIHITDVIERCIKEGKRVGVFQIPEEAWMDMGQIDELQKMKERIGE